MGQREQDEIIVLEVMANEVDAVWWREYRSQLERIFHQRQIIVRSHEITML